MSDEAVYDINLVLEHYGAMTKDRHSYMTQCVFHEDRTPSLSVNTEKGVWNCHSCGEGGNALQLIALKEDCSLADARATAATLGLAEGGAGGGDESIRPFGLASRRRVAPRKGHRQGYRPTFSPGRR